MDNFSVKEMHRFVEEHVNHFYLPLLFVQCIAHQLQTSQNCSPLEISFFECDFIKRYVLLSNYYIEIIISKIMVIDIDMHGLFALQMSP